MIGSGLVQREPKTAQYAQRVGRVPSDGALRVKAFEVAEQQQSEVPPRRKPRASHNRRIERRAAFLNEGVAPRRVENAIQARVEGMAGPGRQVGCGHLHRDLPLSASPFAHRHAGSVVREINRVDPLLVTFTTGCYSG